MRTLPVLRVITRLNIGGPAIQALMLTRELRDRFPTVLAAGKPPSEEGELSDPGVEVQHVPLIRAVRPFQDAHARRVIKQMIAKGRFGLVHTHMAKAGALGRSAAWAMKRPPLTVHTFHGHVLDGYFGRAARAALVRVERSLASRTDALVAVSEETRNALLELGIGRPEQWHVVPLGFDLSPFAKVEGHTRVLRRALRLDDDVHLVGVVGRLAPIKDHMTLLDALARPGLDAHLVVLGDGEMRGSLEARAIALGIDRRVHFVGWRMDMADCLGDMDLVVLSSRNEGTPVSLIEALASARAVVATDVGGVRSVVDDGTTGLLVPAGDAAELGRAIDRLLSDEEVRGSMGVKGRALMLERFAKERLLVDIASLYDGLIAGRQ